MENDTEQDAEYDDPELDEAEGPSELEQEFTQVLKEHEKEIRRELAMARMAVRNAMDLAEAYGIPFSHDQDIYVPASFWAKYSDLVWEEDSDGERTFEEKFGIYIKEPNEQIEGWQTSYC